MGAGILQSFRAPAMRTGVTFAVDASGLAGEDAAARGVDEV